MGLKFLFVLCVMWVVLTSVVSKPLATGPEVISDGVEMSLVRVKRDFVTGGGECPVGQIKINGVCVDGDSDYD